MSEREILEGWKGIASYFDKGVRAVQKWEKEKNLPVHRLENRVFAYKDEVDEWRSTQSLSPELPKREPRRIWLAAAGVSIVFFAVLAWYVTRPGTPATWQVQDNTLYVFDENERECWTKEFPSLSPTYYQGKIRARNGLLIDIDEDGRNELLFSEIPEGIRDTISGTLIAFNPKGKELWKLPYGQAKNYGDRPFSPYYESRILKTATAKGKTYIILSVSHKWFPTQVLLINPKTGQVIEDYWHPGHLTGNAIADLDGDGDDEIILGGNNNPGKGIGHPGIALLEIPFKDNPRKLPPIYPIEYTGGAASQYLLFPNPALAEIVHAVSAVTNIHIDENSIRVLIHVGVRGTIQYQLDKNLNILGAWPGDSLNVWHRELQLKGHLPPGELTSLDTILKLPATPDGNHPTIQELFTKTTPQHSKK